MGRRDYYDDPDAPAANSLVPAASAVVVDDERPHPASAPSRQRQVGTARRQDGAR